MIDPGFWWLNGLYMKVTFFRLIIHFILSAVTLAGSYKINTGIYAKFKIWQIKIVKFSAYFVHVSVLISRFYVRLCLLHPFSTVSQRFSKLIEGKQNLSA